MSLLIAANDLKQALGSNAGRMLSRALVTDTTISETSTRVTNRVQFLDEYNIHVLIVTVDRNDRIVDWTLR